jgi:hypothetical protein
VLNRSRRCWRSIISSSAPRSRAARHTQWPIGPAPRTTTRSPDAILARTTARTPIDIGSTIAATAGFSVRIGNTCSSIVDRRSCRPDAREQRAPACGESSPVKKW